MDEQQILSVDDYLKNEELIAKTPDLIEYDEEDNSENIVIKKKNGVGKKSDKEEEDKDKLPKLASASDCLTKNARKSLEYYLRKSPQVRVLDKQIDLLKEEALNYKSAGKKDLFQKTQDMLVQLTQNRNKFVKIYKQKDYKKVKSETDIKIMNSDELKELKSIQKALEKEFRNTNPNSIITRLNEYRDLLKKNSFEAIDFEEDDDSIVDIDEVLDNEEMDALDEKKLPIDKKYRKLVQLISDKIGITPAEVDNTKSSQLLTMLKAVTNMDEVAQIRKELDDVKFETSNEIAKLRGNEDITNIMFEIFDFETVPEQQPKEMLAASNVGYVKAVAYSQCMKLNMLHNLDDAVAYGLLGLSIAIDKWYNIQKLKDSAASFNGFAHLYVLNSIKKGLYELTSGGVLNKSSIATFMHKRAKAIDAFLQSNPDLKDIPSDMLENFVEGTFDNIGQVMTEGEYTDMIGGADGENNGDIWANAASSNLNDEKFMESKLEYENLIKSIKALFSLFETKTREDGSKFNTKWKLFSKYEYKLFKLAYGLEYKTTNVDGKTTVKDNYNQTEIAQIMQDFYRANGATNKTFSQGGINYQLQQLELKIKAALDEHPALKAGFEYIYNYWAANSQDMSLLSNSREKLDIEFVDSSLKGKSESAQQQIENDLSSGKRLSAITDSTEYNPLDEELADTFRNF